NLQIFDLLRFFGFLGFPRILEQDFWARCKYRRWSRLYFFFPIFLGNGSQRSKAFRQHLSLSISSMADSSRRLEMRDGDDDVDSRMFNSAMLSLDIRSRFLK